MWATILDVVNVIFKLSFHLWNWVFSELGIVGAAIAQLFRLWLVIRIIA
jgi:hypothetical protein